ncbi:hypothetical protein LRS06_08760 [Hymenobacter sp. J193]|uniref:hypothetical protein n=1 Tax=Hymenobacter sp. J193 TaxID=2898429 RepID=UPI0021518228|nr:hypothetical protein [Hymenobacter sp. J193]MCR5887867.1 hypothetical protein [Hymenobacter sp. J193]
MLGVAEKASVAAASQGRQNIDSLLEAQHVVLSPKDAAALRKLDTVANRQANTGASLNIGSVKLRAEEIHALPEEPSVAQLDSFIRTKGAEPSALSRLIVKRAIRWRDATTGDVVHQLLRAGSVMMFLLMPLAALLLKGAYVRRKKRYISHLIFTIHLHCFLFLFFCFWLGISAIPYLGGLTEWLWVVPVVYFLVALRSFYEQGWGKTLAKSLLLGFTYFLTLTFCVVGVILLGVAVF